MAARYVLRASDECSKLQASMQHQGDLHSKSDSQIPSLAEQEYPVILRLMNASALNGMRLLWTDAPFGMVRLDKDHGATEAMNEVPVYFKRLQPVSQSSIHVVILNTKVKDALLAPARAYAQAV